MWNQLHNQKIKNFKTPRVPRIEERDEQYVLVKYNFSNYKFDVPIFSGVIKRVIFNEITEL